MMKSLFICLSLSIAAFLVVLQPVFAGNALPVFVSISPQRYFVQQIGKENVSISVMVQPGASPATYEPKPKQMAALAKTKVYFAVGVPFEKAWLGKISAANPEMVIVHTDQDIEKRAMVATHLHGDSPSHDSGETHEDDGHHHGALDPHIWLSPPLVKMQAKAVLAALQKMDPQRKSVYEANFRAFISELGVLDDELKAAFADRRGMQFIVFHPSWGYFADTYGLRQVPIEIEGKHPKPAQLRELIAFARSRQIKVVFAQPQFSSRSADLVAREIGGRVVFADPLAENWPENLREVARMILSAGK